MSLNRRQFVQATGVAGFLLRSQMMQAMQAAQPPAQRVPQPPEIPWSPTFGPTKVSLVSGDDRRKNVYEAMLAIDDQIRPKLKDKKYVLIKPNNVSVAIQLAATNVDALRGILDYLSTRFKGPVVIAEASAQDTFVGFENFKYNQVISEYPAQKISLVDLNREGKYVILPLVDENLHVQPIRLAQRVIDPDAFVISSAMLKAHNIVVATMSVKNMAMGSPLKSAPGDPHPWNDKRKMHPGTRQANFNMLLVAQKLQPNWGMAVIDGFEGMEGNGPSNGTMVPSHIAIASTDLVAADRVGLECMGVNPDWVGYLTFAGKVGLGQFDLSKIEVVGPNPLTVQKKYKLHDDLKQELEWMGPLGDTPKQTSSLPQLHDYFAC